MRQSDGQLSGLKSALRLTRIGPGAMHSARPSDSANNPIDSYDLASKSILLTLS